MRRLVVLRPRERAGTTLARIAEAGGEGIGLPLFALEPLAWNAPDPAGFDALALTSVNTVTLAGPELAFLAALPVWTVGEATAQAAREAGLTVAHAGSSDAAALFGAMADAGVARALWLAGEDHRPKPARPNLTVIATYRAAPIPVDPAALAGAVALVHSPRAAARLAEIVTPGSRGTIHLAVISAAAADAAGPGWAGVAVATRPTDAALVAAAIDRARAHADKRSR
ncbi:uroporphyrinogen-III synthase [Sphingomonas gilva]|uniref:Uroporphyrinogen-III synthase n=1 Tax=Sphingomonas gilva TaxID=2305907 RepID=A0A396RQM6_9SPHN|nr:uroporphyrinogen-III synthase [Sphingomonas gilva]RHW18689.1 uroporphyrinogen-III synthase [Sphingomonas gilva]